VIARAHACAAEFNARMRRSVAQLAGNPAKVFVERFGSMWATRCDAGGAPGWMNILGPVSAADVELLPRAFGWYAPGVPRIEMAPLPGYEKVAPLLAARGMVQTHHLDILRGPVHHLPAVEGVDVQRVAPGEEMLFADTLLAGHGGAFSDAETQGLAALAAGGTVSAYIARVDGEPAAAAMLHIDGETAYLANASALEAHRGRGCHTTLIAARLRDAVAAGCTEVLGLAGIASSSHRNMERAGLHTLVTVSTWTFPPHD
jgi:Acetyltransferase (GNAT) domain